MWHASTFREILLLGQSLPFKSVSSLRIRFPRKHVNWKKTMLNFSIPSSVYVLPPNTVYRSDLCRCRHAGIRSASFIFNLLWPTAMKTIGHNRCMACFRSSASWFRDSKEWLEFFTLLVCVLFRALDMVLKLSSGQYAKLLETELSEMCSAP